MSAMYTLSDAKVKHSLSRDITVAVINESRFAQFIGMGNNALIKTQKEDGLSGTATMKFRGLIRNGGVSGDEDFDTNEGSLTYLSQTVGLESSGNSVKSGKSVKILSQVHFENFREDAKDGLTESETDKMDRRIYARMTDGATNIVASGNHTDLTTGSIAAGDVLTVADVEEAARRAREGKLANGSAAPRLRPIKTIVSKDAHGIEVKREIFVMFVGSRSAYNLKQDPAWQAKQEAAADLGMGSFIFSSQLGVIDDVVLVQHSTNSSEYAGIYTSADTGIDGQDFSGFAGASSLKTEINLFCGANAMLMPMDTGYNYYEDKYDMDRKVKVAVDRLYGLAKTHYVGKAGTTEVDSIYHDKDYGVIAVVSAES
jgi:N4-gp56 family major capsid protein